MKIRCDVCEKAEASVFCTADEAALCEACDRRVHRANKLAGKHHRFSLLHPSFQDSPLCDICQEKRAFLFCHEDRAILCRECDIPIHTANEHTQRHNRFLLTGVKLSSYNPTSAAANNTTADSCCKSSSQQQQLPAGTHNNNNHNHTNKRQWDDDDHDHHQRRAASHSPAPSHSVDESAHVSSYSSGSGDTGGSNNVSPSNISDYLDTLPGWRVDDFLLDPKFTAGGADDFWTTPYM